MGAVIDAVLRLLPPTLVVENVPEMLWSQQWLSFEKLLSGAGYTVETCIVDAAKLGVPQRRRRAIVVASLHGGVVGLKAACDVVQARRTTVMSDEFPAWGTSTTATGSRGVNASTVQRRRRRRRCGRTACLCLGPARTVGGRATWAAYTGVTY